MRSIISITVAVLIALHSVLGCCWHHGHAAAANVRAVRDGSAMPATSVGCHCRPAIVAAPADASPERTPLPEREPCREKCDLVVKVRAEHDDGVDCGLVVLSSIIDPLPVCADIARVAAERHGDSSAPLPIRRHLLLQRLSI